METNYKALYKKGIEGLKKLTDSTGLIQHSHFSVPDSKHGYSLDDNARALIVSLQAEEFDLSQIYLSFLKHGQSEDGKFHNFLSYKREWLDSPSLGDSFGRSVWALGFCVAQSPMKGLAQSAGWMMERSLSHLSYLTDLRAMAFTIMGIDSLLKGSSGSFQEVELKKVLGVLSDKLVNTFENNSKDDWSWFEQILTYENARLSQALLISYKHLKKEQYLQVALRSLDFLIEIQFDSKKGYFNFIGQFGWFQKGAELALFDQQPVEAGSTVEMLVEAYKITGNKKYLGLAKTALAWFEGKNVNNQSLIDPQTGRIHDGLNRNGVNQNEGAESLVSFLLACDSIINR